MIGQISLNLALKVRIQTVLPFLSDILVDEWYPSTKRESNTQVQAKAIECVLGLFFEFENDKIDTVEVEP